MQQTNKNKTRTHQRLKRKKDNNSDKQIHINGLAAVFFSFVIDKEIYLYIH